MDYNGNDGLRFSTINTPRRLAAPHSVLPTEDDKECLAKNTTKNTHEVHENSRKKS